ncbi:MAG: hypothetical protein KC422_01890 [Trueperaceae bacterium]|nr:hypothetical protein [Trueperaceae bacterium]
MFKTLHARLILVLLLLFIPLASVFVWLTLRSSQSYFQELTQEINVNLAQSLVVDSPGLMIDEAVDATAFSDLAKMLAMTNPGVDIYVLTQEGRIIGASIPAAELERELVDTQPISAFLNRSKTFPIVADDPLSGGKKIFSAAEIDSGKGYLYVILADRTRASLLKTILGSTVLQLVLWGLGVLLVLVGGLGIIAFRLLTRRLRKLEQAMTSFKEQDYVLEAPLLATLAQPQDEIDRLQNVFSDMASRISEQLLGLRQVDRLRRELISNVSHDLRTPLAALRGYLETLQMKSKTLSDTDKERYLAVATRQSERLGELVADLFDLSRFDADAVQAELELFPLQELVQDVVLKFQDHARHKGVDLKLELDADLPLIKIDLGLMERALTNLIDNAIKHTPTGGVVHLDLAKTEQNLLLRIRDTGPGISEKDREHIFERYYRASNERGSDGAGLGLAITKRIVELHGASIWLESQTTGGATFSIAFPVKQ